MFQVPLDDGTEVAPFDQLHYLEIAIVRLSHFVNWNDIGMVKDRERFAFVPE